MNIILGTVNVWVIHEGFTADKFFHALSIILSPSDLLAVGVYNPPQQFQGWLSGNAISVGRNNKQEPFSVECFDDNREEFPNGREYVFNPTNDILSRLACMGGQHTWADLFCEHILAYKDCGVFVPLFDFHDAFGGGELTLSGHYQRDVIHAFACSLGVKYELVLNPVLNFLIKGESTSA